jgi:hypothetical protein
VYVCINGGFGTSKSANLKQHHAAAMVPYAATRQYLDMCFPARMKRH